MNFFNLWALRAKLAVQIKLEEGKTECVVATRMAATRSGFSRPAAFSSDLKNGGHLQLLRESILCFVS